MHIFDNLKKYERKPLSPKNTEDIPVRELTRKEIIRDFFEKTFALWLILGALAIFGTLWYAFSLSFCGMMFFGILSLIAFVIITPGFAKLSDLFEKKSLVRQKVVH